MKRNLLIQMKNEWRDNVWLILELAIVCLVICVTIVFLSFQTEGLRSPRGFNPENVYTIEASNIPKESRHFIDLGDKTSSSNAEDFLTLLGRLRENPNIEAAAITWNAVPYNFNYSGNIISVVDDQDSVKYYGNSRWASADIVVVLEVTSLTGATRKQLKEMLKRGEILITDNSNYVREGRDPFALKGKKVFFGNDTTKIYRVGDVVQNIRRTDFEASWAGGFIVPLPEDGSSWGKIVIRVKPGKTEAFINDFKTKPELRSLRNIYLSDLQSLMDIREACQRGESINIRISVGLIIFLLTTIFLGLLGSFWFRMQQRVSEIAIRKVCGAKRRQIFARVISEGMILLVGAAVICLAVLTPLRDNSMISVEWSRFLVAVAVTVVLVAIGIVISLWYPARKAMNIEPAIAIKDE